MKYRYIIICALAALIAAFSGGDSSAQGVKHGSPIQSALVGNGDGLIQIGRGAQPQDWLCVPGF